MGLAATRRSWSSTTPTSTAVEGAIAAKYRNSGQTCVCTNRFFVQAGMRVRRSWRRQAKLKVGSGLEDGTQQGPLIDVRLSEGRGIRRRRQSQGGRVVAGGKRHALGGSFYEPTVIADAKPEMKFMKKSSACRAPVFRFEAEEEAIRLANDTSSASRLFLPAISAAPSVSWKAGHGMVGVNRASSPRSRRRSAASRSGLGREGDTRASGTTWIRNMSAWGLGL